MTGFQLFLIALGGAAGSVLRALSGQAAFFLFGPAFPAGTLFVNSLGSFLIGAFSAALSFRFPDHPWLGALLLTGFTGGFTTFSAFSLDIVLLYERGALMTALFYMSVSIIASVAGLLAGREAARMFLA